MARVTGRSWPAALGASLLLHLVVGLALLLVLGRRDTTTPERTTTPPRPFDVLRIGALLPRAARPAATPPAPAPAAKSPAPGQAGRPMALPPADVVPTLTAAVDTAAEPVPSTGGGEGDGEPGAPTGGTDGTGPAAAGVAGAPEASAPVAGPSASLVAEVHGRLAAAARDCYPAQAKRFRQRGLVPLSFCVSNDGAAEQVSVTRSGLALLDDAARGCVLGRAAPFPAASRGQCFAVEVEFGGGASTTAQH